MICPCYKHEIVDLLCFDWVLFIAYWRRNEALVLRWCSIVDVLTCWLCSKQRFFIDLLDSVRSEIQSKSNLVSSNILSKLQNCQQKLKTSNYLWVNQIISIKLFQSSRKVVWSTHLINPVKSVGIIEANNSNRLFALVYKQYSICEPTKSSRPKSRFVFGVKSLWDVMQRWISKWISTPIQRIGCTGFVLLQIWVKRRPV